jgi:site-specific DNA-cytosine methylase
MAKVLVACEYSGAVRDAFIAAGHDAMSCDLLPTDAPGPHYQGDMFDLELSDFNLLIAFPPCTHLAVSGARWFAEKRADGRQQAALDFVRRIMDAPVERIAIENPVSIISSQIRKPDQTIQPWQYGHGETKRTCLWLKGLPELSPTDIVDGREPRVWKLPPSEDRWKERSKTFPGIAAAMADQWGAVL